MLNDPVRHPEREGKEIFYPGVVFLPATDTELKVTMLIPKVFLVIRKEPTGDWWPGETKDEVMAVCLEENNAKKYVSREQKRHEKGVYQWEIKPLEVSDYEPPANLLIDAKPEYGAVVIPFDDQDVLRESIDKTAAFEEAAGLPYSLVEEQEHERE